MERIESLRKLALEQGSYHKEFIYLFYKAYAGLTELPEYARYGESFYIAMDQLTPVIYDGELIVGNSGCALSEKEELEWRTQYDKCNVNGGLNKGQDSHMAIDYDLVLSEGVLGMIRKIDAYAAQTPDPEKKNFYGTCKRCLEGVLVHAHHYADKALELSRETDDPARKEELLRLADICRRVPAHPASTFYEAVQSVHFITHCITRNPFRPNNNQFQLGHPDRYLWPYYEKDIRDGVITKEFAQLLLDCLGIQINMRVPRGLSSGYMVGGRDTNGNIIANELTLMCMQVIEDIRLVYPSVGLCYTKGMPETYLAEACRILSKGHSHPAIFQDDIISKGLQYYGVTEAESHNYIHSTCVEITPVAASNVWVASPYTNMAQLLLDVMDKEYPSYEDLIQEYLDRLDRRIRENFESQNDYRRLRSTYSMNPLLSCFVNDCLERGTDIEKGGARYNWIMPSFVGMANLVDSLYAVKQLVFMDQKVTIHDLKAVLDDNFDSDEALRLYIQNKLPKYGNDIDEIDRYFGFFTDHIAEECRKYTAMHSNGRLIPSVFCWVKHEEFGRETSATPDGRKSGFPLGDGSGPCQGREYNGPTASILSSTKWDHSKFIGGVAVNLKFAKSSLGPDALETMQTLIRTYLERGGFELQINVVDRETLLEAQHHPEQYSDLVVRIGGYSDYFVKLSPEMQAELLARTAHNI